MAKKFEHTNELGKLELLVQHDRITLQFTYKGDKHCTIFKELPLTDAAADEIKFAEQNATRNERWGQIEEQVNEHMSLLYDEPVTVH